jgi:hypothetical protein
MKTTVAGSAIRTESTIGSKLLALPDPITSDFRPLLSLIEPASISELWEAQKELQVEKIALGWLNLTDNALAWARIGLEDRDYKGNTLYTDLSQNQVDQIDIRFSELKERNLPFDNLSSEQLRINRILYLTLCELFQKQSISLDSGDHMRANHCTGALMDSIAESNKRMETAGCPLIEFFNNTSFIYLKAKSGEVSLPGGWQWMPPRDVLTATPETREAYTSLFLNDIDSRQILAHEIAQRAFELRAKFIDECRA